MVRYAQIQLALIWSLGFLEYFFVRHYVVSDHSLAQTTCKPPLNAINSILTLEIDFHKSITSFYSGKYTGREIIERFSSGSKICRPGIIGERELTGLYGTLRGI